MPYEAIHQNLILGELRLNKWLIAHHIRGPRGGVYFAQTCWTENGIAKKFNATLIANHHLRGHRLLFEFFQLEATLEVKISAKVLITDGNLVELVSQNTLYEALLRLALEVGAPQPQAVRALKTRACAVWPSPRPSFQRDDIEGMANWIRKFFDDPPQDFCRFVEEAILILKGSHTPK
jgi:hypothetical protein